MLGALQPRQMGAVCRWCGGAIIVSLFVAKKALRQQAKCAEIEPVYCTPFTHLLQVD
jgi:hypothetical protein